MLLSSYCNRYFHFHWNKTAASPSTQGMGYPI